MQNTYKLCNLVTKGEKHREEIYLGKTKKDRVGLTTVGNSMMADLVLLVNSISKLLIDLSWRRRLKYE